MNEKILALLDKYDAHAATYGVQAEKVNDRATGAKDALGHVRWMIQQMKDRGVRDKWSVRKTNRWLGFIHGVLWCHGGAGIVGLRDDSRHLYDEDEVKG